MMLERETSRGFTASRVVASPTVLLLVALTVQIAVGGPALAAAVVRQEVATEREGFRRLSSTLALAFVSVGAAAVPVVDRVRVCVALSEACECVFSGRQREHSDLRLVLQRIDLPPPSMLPSA